MISLYSAFSVASPRINYNRSLGTGLSEPEQDTALVRWMNIYLKSTPGHGVRSQTGSGAERRADLLNRSVAFCRIDLYRNG